MRGYSAGHFMQTACAGGEPAPSPAVYTIPYHTITSLLETGIWAARAPACTICRTSASICAIILASSTPHQRGTQQRRHKSVLLKPRSSASGRGSLPRSRLACASLAWWHAQAAPRPAPFARDAERIVADVDWSRTVPGQYVYARRGRCRTGPPATRRPTTSTRAEPLGSWWRRSRKLLGSRRAAGLFLIPVLPRAKHWSDWMRRCGS